MTGQEIKALAQNACVPLWKIADALGVTEWTFSRKLRRDFTDDETARILSVIEELRAK